MDQIKIFAPATVANVSCGFDVLGFALDTIGDEMHIRKSDKKGITITKIVGEDLPYDAKKNVVGAAGYALLDALNSDAGFEIDIYKKIKPGSGIGSSAASAAGTVFAINKLLGNPFNNTELVRFAMEGERLACGSAIADNVSAALFGGFTLVRSYAPLDIIKINTPNQLYATVIHPQIEIKTADARRVLKDTVPLKDAIKQWGNVGGLISGLYTEDYGLISRSLHDYVAEPFRSVLIPGFDLVKQKSIEAGALGCGISGSGPSIFALSKGLENAQKVADAMKEVYKNIGIDFYVYVSKINTEGVKIIS
ncbi:MAG: homoserine kinase [Flavobacteriales bacterium]|jgi:homoserine kinase|nr:homoserine kinase [Flavobacteriales bacterium]